MANGAASLKKTTLKALRIGTKASKTAKKANKTADTALKTARRALAQGGAAGPAGPPGSAGKDLVLNDQGRRHHSRPGRTLSGSRSAERGYFCLYQRVSTADFTAIGDPATGTAGVGTLGAQVSFTASRATRSAVGTWAVTAP